LDVADFDSGIPSGWIVNPQPMLNNPCSPSGADGTPHLWMGNNGSAPRTINTKVYDFSAHTHGVVVCFDLFFATQGVAAPCEGPDEPNEGVYLQYSLNGVNWNAIHYFDPNGGNDINLTNWNNYCFNVPQVALSSTVTFRFIQTN